MQPCPQHFKADPRRLALGGTALALSLAAGLLACATPAAMDRPCPSAAP